MPSYDAIIIGGGTNGLAAAGRLAKAGRKVLVLESAAVAGGGATTKEFAKGYKVSAVAHLLNLLDPRVEQGLGLQSFLCRHQHFHNRTIAHRRPSRAAGQLRRDNCGKPFGCGPRLMGRAAPEAAALCRRAEALQGHDPAAPRQGRRQ